MTFVLADTRSWATERATREKLWVEESTAIRCAIKLANDVESVSDLGWEIRRHVGAAAWQNERISTVLKHIGELDASSGGRASESGVCGLTDHGSLEKLCAAQE